MSNWVPGSFTPARCDLWERLNPAGKIWLTGEIIEEEKSGVQYSSELPPVPDHHWIDKPLGVK